MRTGGYTLQQSLTAEAATIAKQAVSLARRRGHAQVTPLHVATIMFASSTCLFKRACLQSHSHPLQSKALELCFNVALNRLQTSTSNSILPSHHHHHHLPSLSNAMIAAFKRAQAHQRRGCAENHQQPILAVKIDIEQLVISILDDPSVSRVMREAGFSSAQVKAKVEQNTAASAVGANAVIRSDKECDILPKPMNIIGNWGSQTLPSSSHDFKFSIMKSSDQHAKNDDVMSVIETLKNKKTRNIVIVGECGVTSENVVRGVIEKIDCGNDVPKEMQSMQFISVPLYTLRNISRQEFEAKLEELRALVKSLASRGVVLYLGDLRWICEFWWRYKEQLQMSGGSGGGCVYSPVEEMVIELSKLARGFGGNIGKLWIMGTASFQTYMKCKNGNPSLEALWDLHPITIPVGTLSLGLNLESDLKKNNVRSKEAEEGSSSCRNCYNMEAQKSSQECDLLGKTNSSSLLPAWLQKYKQDQEITQIITHHHQEEENIKNASWKWSTICNYYPTTSSASNDSKNNLQICLNWESNHSPKEQNFFALEEEPDKLENKPDLLSNPNSSPNSASSSEASGEIPGLPSRFNEQTQENFDILSSVLEKVVPLQKDAVHETVSTILECRSKKDREDTWLCFTGLDSESKEKIAMELAKVVFGSVENFIAISVSSFSSERSVDNEEVISNKRTRHEEGRSYFERFQDKVKENPCRVFFMEDMEQVDYSSIKCFKNAMDSGSFRLCDGELVSLKDAIIIFCSDSFSSRGPRASFGIEDDEDDEVMDSELDLNVAAYDCDDDGGGILRFIENVVVFNN